MPKLWQILKKNHIIISTIIVAIIIELLAITYTDCIPFLTAPIYPLIILAFFILIGSLILRKSLRLLFYTILLIIQTIINTGFIFLYDSNGTVFEWAMFNQRTDAYGTVETFQLKTAYIITCIVCIVLYILINMLIIKKSKEKKIYFNKNRFKLAGSIIALCFIISIPYVNQKMNSNNFYKDKIYSTTANNYQTIGIMGNTFYQLIKGKDELFIDTTEDVEDFIYQDYILTSQYNGISKDNNLIIILVESLEWFPFDLYPEYQNKLYPNLTKLIEEGLILDNFYQKEKTDVSEALAVLGNYPTGQYINYDFYKNKYPFSLPNLLKHDDANIIVNSFHANYGNFYNRYKLHNNWGFNQFYGIKEMKEFGVEDEWQHKKGERNLDSITFERMKESMFPTDERFFSYILSFTMHGFYGERKNLSEYYKIIDELKILENKTSKMDRYLKTYLAAMMDFDKAIGIMMDYLKTNKLDKKTTIILYSDHNAYYNSLSNYVKDIDKKFDVELYRIPCIIYDQKLTKAYKKENNSNIISKFTTTSDITPTVLDIFGIKGWKNLYFGNTVLKEDIQSIVYSRNYNFFLTEKFAGYSLNSKHNLTKKEFKDVETRALRHLEILKYVDKIYYTNYFKDHDYLYDKDSLNNCCCNCKKY